MEDQDFLALLEFCEKTLEIDELLLELKRLEEGFQSVRQRSELTALTEEAEVIERRLAELRASRKELLSRTKNRRRLHQLAS